MDLPTASNPIDEEKYQAWLSERKVRSERRVAEKLGCSATTTARCPSPQNAESHIQESRHESRVEVRQATLAQTDVFMNSIDALLAAG